VTKSLFSKYSLAISTCASFLICCNLSNMAQD